MTSELLKILKHTLIYGAGNILAKMIGFLLIPVYTRYLTPADYGVIEILDLTVTLLSTLIGYSITSSIVRFYYQQKEEADKGRLVSTGLLFVGAAALTVTLGVLPFASAVSRLMFNADGYGHYLSVVLFTLLFQIIGDYCMAYVQVRQESMRYTLYSIAKLCLGLALNILFVVVLRKGALGIVYSNAITAGATAAVMGALTLSRTGLGFSREMLRTMLIYGSPLIFGALSNFVLTFSDRYFLNHYASLHEVGLYALGYKMSMLLPVLITSPFLSIWSAKRYEIAERPDAGTLAARVFTYFAFVAVLAGLSISVFADDILKLVAAEEFHGASRFIPILVAGYVCNAFYYHFNFGIYIKNKTKRIALILLSAAALNTLLNWILIREYAGMGAAVSTALSFLYVTAVSYVVSNRLYKLPYEWGRIVSLVVLAVALFLLSRAVHTGSLFGDLAAKMALVAAFPVALYPMRFYRGLEVSRLKSMAMAKLGIGSAEGA